MCSITWHRLPVHAWMTPGGNSSRRQELRAVKTIPALSEIESRLGSPLANVFFQSMNAYSGAVDQMGLGQKLKGATQQLWVSPERSLKGEMVLTEPNNPRCLKALTHKAILYLGKAHELAVEEETKRMIKQAVDNVTIALTKEKEHEIEEAIQRTKAAEQERCRILTEQIQQEIDNMIKKATDEIEKKLLAEAKADKEEALRNLHDCMQNQLYVAVDETEKHLTKKFNFKLMWEGNKYYEFYRDKIMEQQKKWSCMLEEAKLIFLKEIRKIKIDLKAQHVTDLLFTHKEAAAEINRIKEEMNKELEMCLKAKQTEILEKESALDTDINLKCKDEKIKFLKEKLRDLMEQFQMFIQMTLKDNTSQTQYLLSLQEILKDDFECDNDQISLKESESKETIEIVMAIIFEIIVRQYCCKQPSDSDSCLQESYELKKTPCKTFEERVERERAANRAVNLIVSGMKTVKTKDNKQIAGMAKRVKTVKNVLTRHPSILELFLETKTAVQAKTRATNKYPSYTELEGEEEESERGKYPKKEYDCSLFTKGCPPPKNNKKENSVSKSQPDYKHQSKQNIRNSLKSEPRRSNNSQKFSENKRKTSSKTFSEKRRTV